MVVATFNQENALGGAFSVITNLRMELFQALVTTDAPVPRCDACEKKWPMYEFMTKSTAKPGVTAKALHHIKKMYSTIAKLTASDLQAGHYDRWVDMNN